MNSIEKEEIRALPPKYRPLGAWAYFGYQLLFCIPLAGLICMIVFACSSDNINRRSYARSYFCVYLIVGIVLVIVLVAGGGCLAAMLARK